MGKGRLIVGLWKRGWRSAPHAFASGIRIVRWDLWSRIGNDRLQDVFNQIKRLWFTLDRHRQRQPRGCFPGNIGLSDPYLPQYRKRYQEVHWLAFRNRTLLRDGSRQQLRLSDPLPAWQARDSRQHGKFPNRSSTSHAWWWLPRTGRKWTLPFTRCRQKPSCFWNRRKRLLINIVRYTISLCATCKRIPLIFGGCTDISPMV